MVDDPDRRQDVEVLKIPAAKTADKLGNRIVANMIMLGALQAKTGIVSKDALMKSMEDSVASRFVEINRKAIKTGGQILGGIAAGGEDSSGGLG
jgi:2-oxoglutarate ferredoxin oxidoreductase subunit gamma